MFGEDKCYFFCYISYRLQSVVDYLYRFFLKLIQSLIYDLIIGSFWMFIMQCGIVIRYVMKCCYNYFLR